MPAKITKFTPKSESKSTRATKAPHIEPAETQAAVVEQPAVVTSIESTENVEAQESPTEQLSETVEESAAAQREAKVFTPVQVRKLAREKIWAWSRKHNLPLTRSGAKDEGYTLATDEIGGTAGRVLIGYHAPEMEDIEKRRQFAAVQLNKVGLMLRAGGVAIEMTTLDGEPTLVVPTTRVPGKPDEKPAKRGNQAAAAKRWTVQLSGDEQEGSGI